MKRSRDLDDNDDRKIRKVDDHINRTLNVTPIDELYSDTLPSFRLPVEIGHFSLDVERKFNDDSHQQKYFCPPHTIRFDLSLGYKEFVSRDENVKERLDHLLMWVDKHRQRFELSNKESVENGQAGSSSSSSFASLNTDFITWRGHLTKILCTPYETREPWKMAVTLYRGTIYLSEVETQEACDRRKNMEEKYKEMCYWGHRFETYVCKLVSEKTKKNYGETSSALEGASSEDKTTSASSKRDCPTNNCEGFISVVRTRLERHSLVFGAEVDCCTRETEQSPGNYIELKTSNQPHTHQQRRSFKRYKLLKWWAQSYLAGVPKIICGFRHHHGVVNELQTYNTLDIPRIVRNEEDMWDMNICLNFVNKFLDWVKKVVVEDNPRKVYMFSFSAPFNNISVVESEDGMFLPEWYVKDV